MEKKHFPDLEKSWNLKKGQNYGKLMDFENIVAANFQN